jgi:hypothetical protein
MDHFNYFWTPHTAQLIAESPESPPHHAPFPWPQSVVDAPLIAVSLNSGHRRVGRDSPWPVPHVRGAGYDHQPRFICFPPVTLQANTFAWWKIVEE